MRPVVVAQRAWAITRVKENILEYAIKIGEVAATTPDDCEFVTAGGSMEPDTGDNPGAIFGGRYSRFVIDEASRQKSCQRSGRGHDDRPTKRARSDSHSTSSTARRTGRFGNLLQVKA